MRAASRPGRGPALVTIRRIQRDSRPGFSTWASRCGWLGNGVIPLLVAIVAVRSLTTGRRTGLWWFGLALLFGSALVLEAVLIQHVWPGLMPGDAAHAATAMHALVPIVSMAVWHVIVRGQPARQAPERQRGAEAPAGSDDGRRPHLLQAEAAAPAAASERET